MRLAFQLAYRNLIGAGLRTWLNVGVLSFAFVLIIFYHGLIEGWNKQASKAAIDWEIGSGQLLNANYDPADPFSLQDGHGILPEKEQENLTPVLIRQATIYPEGRMISIALKGISAEQNIVQLPTQLLQESKANIPALIGTRMAKSANLKKGDQLLLRWRDKNGTFDAANVTIAGIFDTDVSSVDQGQIWIPIKKLWEMTGLNGHATYFIANEQFKQEEIEGWDFKTRTDLLEPLAKIIQAKNVGGSIMYLLLMAIALLAIFDTQVLSIFRRQKEIGTYIALGMTRWQVVGLFTAEGSMYSFLATIVGSLYGIPLFVVLSKYGITFPTDSQDIGVAMPDTIYPEFALSLIITTIILVVAAATIVSFLPARKIAKMDPVNALKGKLQ